MIKRFLIFAISLVVFFFSSLPAYSEGEFVVDSKVTYDVAETGKTLVTHEITLENAFSTLYATSYTLSLENIDALNVQAHSDTGNPIPVTSEKQGDKTNIKLIFSDAVVGKGKQRHFFVSYENSSFAVRTGEVWEISIPKLSDENSFRSYLATLTVPIKFGLEAYISPHPQNSGEEGGFRVYTFDKNDLVKTGVTAGFGEFQVFTYTLNYHLENPLARQAETEIAIPPDTAFQKVHVKSINPQPIDIRIDEDGNWLAKYKLGSRQRLDVAVSGEVQIFSSFRAFPKSTQEILSKNLKDTSVWQVNDPEIKALAQKLKTPKAIYDYVATTLKYDYERVRPNVERLGAKAALQNPTQAICMEFTDLFIAIARAAGIPAREINGFAYTENPEIQPLSLVADVLHSWPEYWDQEKGAWIPIDPTWASTTGGVNYFDKLDLRHFTFVIHGADPTKPYAPGSYKLGPNPQKDVFISFGKLSEEKPNYPQISATLKQGLPFLYSILQVRIRNEGQTSFYSVYPEIFFDKKSSFRDFIEVLPPFAIYETSLKVPYSFLGKNSPEKVKIIVDGSQVEVSTNKIKEIVISLLLLFLVFIVLLSFILIRIRKIHLYPRTLLTNLSAKISRLRLKNAKPDNKNQENKDKPQF